jgi:predicted cupin superfamily sugar epimerase
MRHQELIERLALEPHPEGGFYRQTYKAPGTSANGRAHSTAIYFLLPAGHASRLHRIKSDEVWHFYDGDPLCIVELTPDGALQTTRLHREMPQHVVPAGRWFGALPEPGSEFALVGCTVAPGFDFADFELARRGDLVARYPQHRAVIETLTLP